MDNFRYLRQTLLKEIGNEGQARLSKAKIIIVGCGGLGSIAAPYLAGAGIGKIVLVDGDLPQVSNLHRQVMLATEAESLLTKSQVLRDKLVTLNPEIEIVAIGEMLSKENIQAHFSDCDLVLECTDAIMIKYLVNDYCHLNRIPLVYAAIHKFEGYLSFFRNSNSEDIQLRDVFPEPNTDIPSCAEVGVLGTIAGLMGILQANEALKYFAGIGKCLEGRLLTYDALSNNQLVINLKKSFNKDFAEIYKSNSYELVDCSIEELEWSFIQQNRIRYQLVSILADAEHVSLDAKVIQLPLSTSSIADYITIAKTTTVFYCKTGKRSAHLISQLLDKDPSLKIYSLQGGIDRVKSIAKV